MDARQVALERYAHKEISLVYSLLSTNELIKQHKKFNQLLANASTAIDSLLLPKYHVFP